MLQSNSAHAIAEGQQEIVMIIVVGIEKPVGLGHERAVRLEVLRLRLQQVSAIGEDVQPHWRGPRCIEVYPRHIAAGE